jgi:DNA-binding transcriptional regulator GbsR (MarR family)
MGSSDLNVLLRHYELMKRELPRLRQERDDLAARVKEQEEQIGELLRERDHLRYLKDRLTEDLTNERALLQAERRK